jgi:hypothetical protein
MSYLKLDQSDVSSGIVTIPRTGRPTAELLLATDQVPAPGKRVYLRFEDGTTYHMTVRASGPRNGFAEVLLVGGADGLGRLLPPKDYQGVPASLVVRDLFNEAGEIPGDIDLPTVFVRWQRMAGPAYSALAQVMARLPDKNWRVLPDGTVWAGKETWPAGPTGAVVAESAPVRGWYALLPLPALQPGVMLEALVEGQTRALGRVERVIHQIGARLRTAVYVGG